MSGLKKPKRAAGGDPRLDLLLDVPMKMSVELGRTRMAIHELLQLAPGAVVELDRLVGEPLDIKVNGKLVARGEAVVVNGRLGVRVTEILSVNETASLQNLDESA